MSQDPAQALAHCREQIDALDLRLLHLLNERAQVVVEVGRIKREATLPIYEPRREDQVYHNVTAHNQGPLSADALRRIYERIIDEMRKVQKDRMGETC